MKKLKSFLSMLITAAMLISVLYIAPYTASATDEEAPTFTSGDYTYSLLEDGTAKITKYTGSENDLTIPTDLDGNKVTQIGGYSFENCTSIESLTIPEGITAIGDNAFRYCKNIRTVTFADGLITISNGGFSFCESLENVVIPDSVTTLGNYAFQGCTAMTSIELSSNIEVLSDFSLASCENLTSIDIPTSVKEIGQNTFAHCNGLTSVTVPDGVTLINAGAFSYCENLTSVSLPDTLETVNAFAFSNSKKLMEVTVPKSVSEIGRCAFGYWFDKSVWNDIPLQGFVLKGYSGSAAETYAQESGVTFESIVDPNAIKPTGITLSDKEVTVKEKNTVTVKANVLPANATDKKVTWSSNDESVATVAGGVIKGVSEGTAIITASTSNGYTASVTVTVEKRFVTSTKVFFKNTSDWQTVHAYAWKETSPVVNNADWPGEAMTCVDEENKIYCIELGAEVEYEKIIFSNTGSGAKTGNLVIEGYEMLYDFSTSKWEDYIQTEQGTVNVKYVDENGTVLISTSISGDVGAKYTTSAKTIDGYTLKTTPANATGTYTSDTITVTYVYSKNTNNTTGWQKVDGKWYYYDETGKVLTGWKKIDGKWYYLDEQGAMQTGWNKLDGKWYYLNNQGAMQTGWLKLGKTWYYMDKQGAMQTGWNKLDGKWYYLNNQGAMKTGWLKLGNTWYHMGESGAMTTGWLKSNGVWYYMSTSGAMQTGWKYIDGYWYYFNNSGAMQADTYIGSYYVDANGRWVQ